MIAEAALAMTSCTVEADQGVGLARALQTGQLRPRRPLQGWLEEAREAGAPSPSSVAFVTVGADGRPSARTVALKRLDADALIFTSALWTRKARELESNPNVALLFHWPTLGRQAHITGQAARAERELAHELFAERDLPNQLQTLVSRQGTPITGLDPLRARHAHLKATMETPPACPRTGARSASTPTPSSCGLKPQIDSTTAGYTSAARAIGT